MNFSYFPLSLQSLLINSNAKVDSTHNDIIVTNGVVQPIDKLLTPPIFINDNIYQVILKQDSKFQDLALALLLANLVSTLEGIEILLFVAKFQCQKYWKILY